ncbi:MAG TPA: hypothetical protein VH141_11300 [Pseudonocardia sp.]|jgi:hypothetical protein|nr:hypothetical protein [Pseudonocardia sp.]
MHTAVDRFLGKYPTARLGLAAVASIVVLADLIVLVQVAGPTAVDSTANVPTVTAPAPAAPASDLPSTAPTAPTAAPPTSGPAQAPPMLVPPQRTAAPTVAPTVAPTPAQTRARPAPTTTVRPRRSTLPEPTQEGRGHRSPFEQRCRDGEIQPWLCHGLPN